MKPHALLDKVKKQKGLTSDRALADEIEISTPTISKVRNRKIPFGDTLLLKMHIFSDMPFKEMRDLIKGEV